MTFVMKDLDLVLFLNARNRIRANCREAVRSYIQQRKALYSRHCNQEQETKTFRKLRKQIGADPKRNWCDAFHRPLKIKRDLIKDSPWKLPPNRYDIPTQIYKGHKGAGGAHWPKLHTNKSIVEKAAERRVRYNVKIKGKQISWQFPGNARDRRPTARCMVSSTSGCYHDPAEPGPTRYLPNKHMIEERVSPPIISPPPNPHLFLPNSSVPENPNTLVRRHISMEPAPGRYETRYPFFCPCAPKMIYLPGLRLFIDRQKRNRFRGLPFRRIKTRLYCDPEWRHVHGHGFRYLFMLPKSERKDKKPEEKKKEKAPAKAIPNLKLYHEQKYKDMIIEPNRNPISNPTGLMFQLPINIKYNILSKRVIRKQLRSNKKIAFNSGQERWKDGYRLPLVTPSQQQANKEKLPIERQLRDQPVTRVSIRDLTSKLHEIPDHMKPIYEPQLRKRLFKFMPLPTAKVLVTEKDTRPDMLNAKNECERYFGKEIVPEHYFKDVNEQRRVKTEAKRQSVAPSETATVKTGVLEAAAPSEEAPTVKDDTKVKLGE